MQTTIHTLDLQFLGISNAIAAYLIEAPSGPVLIEAGPHSTFPVLKHALATKGYAVSDIRHLLLTHIHLDHAGAAWAFAEQGATIHVHPAGAKHLINPSKLMESARRIYQEQMDRLWGEMHAIPEGQIRETAHGEDLSWLGLPIKAWHTPGHAIHHIAWQLGDSLFTGDVAGVRIQNLLPVPPCPPPDIHLGDWLHSLDLIRGLAPKHLYLTHYGEVSDVNAHLDALTEQLHAWSNWIYPHWEAGEKPEDITPAFQAFVQQTLRAAGVSEGDLPRYEAANPSWMSVAGLLRYWTKQQPAH